SLRAFEAVARSASVKAAALELHVTASAVSHQIQNLESDLGLRLFHRVNRRLVLTDAGEVYRSKVQPAFAALRQATAEMSARSSADAVTLATPPSFAERWLLPRLGRFLAAHPDVDLRVEATRRPAEYLDVPFDAVVRYGHGPWTGLPSRRLVGEHLVVLCAPGLLRGNGLREPADLARHTLIHSEQRLTGWSDWLRSRGLAAVKGTRNIRFSQSTHSLRAAAHGFGVVLENRMMAAEYCASGQLVEPFPELEPVDDGAAYYLTVRPDRADLPRVHALAQWLLAEAAA
ncbi:MAG: transcriptional regulator GcvA, partial [Alphaproteobacteria bacterium]